MKKFEAKCGELFKNWARGAVRCYQLTLAFHFGGECRFWPSCSNYFLIALRAHSLGASIWLFLRRLWRCHPWHPGGVDLPT